MKVETILQHHDARRSARAPFEDKWEQIAAMSLEHTGGFIGDRTPGERLDKGRLDGTMIRSVITLASAIYGYLISDEWFDVGPEDKALAKSSAAKEYLATVNHRLRRSFDPSVSNFYDSLYSWILQLLLFGPSTFYSARPPGRDFIHDMSVPLAQCYFSRDEFGTLTNFDRRWKMTVSTAVSTFGVDAVSPATAEKFKQEPSTTIDILHAVYPEQDYRSGQAWPPRYRSEYIEVEAKHRISRGGYGEMPYFVADWISLAGEEYGRGLGEVALPDMHVLNEIRRTMLLARQLQATPPIATHSELDGALDLRPFAENPGAIDDQGKMLAQRMDVTGNLNAADQEEVMLRAAISDAFLGSAMAAANSPTPSVEEVLINDERRQEAISPFIGRIMSRFLSPFIARRYRMLDDAGQLPPVPDELSDAVMEVRYLSPMVKAHRSKAANATLQYGAAVAQLAQLDPGVQHKFDVMAAADVVHDGLAVPSKVQRSDADVEERARQTQDAQALQQTLDAAEQGSRAVEGFARAEQAASQ